MSEIDISGYRVGAGVWVPIMLLGWLWFAADFGVPMHVYSFVVSVALCTAAVVPVSAYFSKQRLILVAIYSAGIIVTLMAVYMDYSRSYGSDYVAIFLRATQVYILLMLLKLALSGSKGAEDA
jgi:hypothetical protein